ncbi:MULTISPECIES: ATP-binding domain-containing protein [Helicobacter]|nr:NERD domain-containing protein [Helicobacter sp. UBA3407]
MAQFFPPISDIFLFKIQPTEGELALLRFLEVNLDEHYEVYFNPYLNGDRPDIIILRKEWGALIIEVKDWNLESYFIDENKKWRVLHQNTLVKSPISQVCKYKENLFELHIDNLLNLKINNIKYFNIVKCAIYFHKATKEQINTLIQPLKNDKSLRFNIDLLSNDSLTKENFNKIFFKTHSAQNKQYFTDEIYNSFKRVLTPTFHMQNDGNFIEYNKKQKEIISKPIKEMRVKGVFGSGKTTTLVARAVKTYQKLKMDKLHPKILILTYNLTLRNFIRDKLIQVHRDFEIADFTIINYHQFIKAELNNMEIEMEIPHKNKGMEIEEYYDKYYSNEQLFAKNKDKIIPYDAIYIDEIQDYKRSWMNIIKDSFLAPEGEYIIFGDEKQNIYGNPIKNKDIITNILGRPTELKICHRSDSKIRDLTLEFQKTLFSKKYELDNMVNEKIGEGLFEKEGYTKYTYFLNMPIIPTIYDIIRENILHKIHNVSPNDITILGYTLPLLRELDCYYRILSRENTKTMFETTEIMYLSALSDNEKWLDALRNELARNNYPNNTKLSDEQNIKIKKFIAQLLSIAELYAKYPEKIEKCFSEKCENFKIGFDFFLSFLKTNAKEIQGFRSKVNKANYEIIRRNKKIHFWMNCGMLKISTIHSFKGWESQAVFLIIEDKTTKNEFDELLYTGFTRARENLVIINFGNEEYHKILKPMFDKVNKQ